MLLPLILEFDALDCSVTVRELNKRLSLIKTKLTKQ